MINTKLQNIIDTKSAIGNAINNKGGSITVDTPFYEYAPAIENISSGGGAYSTWVAQAQDNSKYTVYNGYDSVTNPTPNLSNNFAFNRWLLNNSATGDVILSNVVVASGGNYNGPNIVRDDTKMDFVSNTLSYGGIIASIAVNNGFIYAVGNTTNLVRKYNESTLAVVGNSASYGDNITTIAINNGFIYVGGVGGESARVRRIDENNLAFVANASSEYEPSIFSIAIKDGFIYAGGAALTGVNRGVVQYHEGNLVRAGSTGNYGGTIRTVAANNGFFYAGGVGANAVRKYNESTRAIVGNTASYGGTVETIAINNGFIYAGGLTANVVRKYDESTLALVGNTATYGGGINSITINNGFIYVGGVTLTGTNRGVAKYHESNLVLVGNTVNYGGTITSIAINNGFIYAGGATNNTVQKFNEFGNSPEQFPYYNITSIKE
jgi:hypothetical protein